MSDSTPEHQGSFEVFTAGERANPGKAIVEMLQRAQRDRYNAIAVAHREAVQCLARLHVPHLPASSSRDHFLAVADFVVRWADIGDRVMKIVGEEIENNAVDKVDLSVFDRPFFGAVDGNATFEIDKHAEAVQANIDDMVGGDPDYEWENRDEA